MRGWGSRVGSPSWHDAPYQPPGCPRLRRETSSWRPISSGRRWPRLISSDASMGVPRASRSPGQPRGVGAVARSSGPGRPLGVAGNRPAVRPRVDSVRAHDTFPVRVHARGGDRHSPRPRKHAEDRYPGSAVRRRPPAELRGVCFRRSLAVDAYSDPSTASASSRFTRWKSRTRPLWIAGNRHRNAESSVSSVPYPFSVFRICKPFLGEFVTAPSGTP